MAPGHAAVRITDQHNRELIYINWIPSRYLTPGQNFRTDIGKEITGKHFGATQHYDDLTDASGAVFHGERSLYLANGYEIKQVDIPARYENGHGLDTQAMIDWWQMFLNEDGRKTIEFDYVVNGTTKHAKQDNARLAQKYSLRYKACSTIAMIALLQGGAEKYVGSYSNFQSFVKAVNQNIANRLAHTMITPENVYNYAEQVRIKIESLNTNNIGLTQIFQLQSRVFPDQSIRPSDFEYGIWTPLVFKDYSKGTHALSHRYKLLQDMDTDLTELHAAFLSNKSTDLILACIDDLLDLIHRFHVNRMKSNRKDAIFTLGKQLMAKRGEIEREIYLMKLARDERARREQKELVDFRSELVYFYQILSGGDLTDNLNAKLYNMIFANQYTELERDAFVKEAKKIFCQETGNVVVYRESLLNSNLATLRIIKAELDSIRLRAESAVTKYIKTLDMS
ncbi:MAG: hypothetical protein ACOYNF_03330 [Rhodoferax sp.]